MTLSFIPPEIAKRIVTGSSNRPKTWMGRLLFKFSWSRVAETVKIARCPEHGLHGARDECFECGGPVEQVEMVEASELERLRLTVSMAVAFLNLRRAEGIAFPYDSRPLRRLREAAS